MLKTVLESPWSGMQVAEDWLSRNSGHRPGVVCWPGVDGGKVTD